MKFIVDTNVGKLAKWLRMIGYDAQFFDGKDDGEIVHQALVEDRVILTRDTRLMEWGVIRSGRIKALLIHSDSQEKQIFQVIHALDLDIQTRAFTLCLVCNRPLVEVERSAVKDKVPPYVFKNQNDFRQCPVCHRIYWRGTHWRAMVEKLDKLHTA